MVVHTTSVDLDKELDLDNHPNVAELPYFLTRPPALDVVLGTGEMSQLKGYVSIILLNFFPIFFKFAWLVLVGFFSIWILAQKEM